MPRLDNLLFRMISFDPRHRVSSMVSPYGVFELLGQPDVFGRSRIVRNFCSSFVLDRGFGNGPSGRIHRDASRFWMRLFP